MEIKRATDLTPRQWYLFLKFYRQYFANEVIESNRNPRLNKLKMKFFSNGSSEHSLARIKNGTLTSYVALDYDKKERGLVPVGFISGHQITDTVLDLCHLYCTIPHPNRLVIVGNMFKALAKEAMKRGMTRVYAESNDFMPVFTDDLNTLGFVTTDIDSSEQLYKRHIYTPVDTQDKR